MQRESSNNKYLILNKVLLSILVVNLLAKWSKEGVGFCLEQNHQAGVRKENFRFLLWWWFCLQSVTSAWLPLLREPKVPWQTGAGRFAWDSQHQRGFQWTQPVPTTFQRSFATQAAKNKSFAHRCLLPAPTAQEQLSSSVSNTPRNFSKPHCKNSNPCLCSRITG